MASSKIVRVINTMISNSEMISNEIQNKKEIYFLYKKKHKWSILESGPDYFLFYYNLDEPIEQIASRPSGYWNENPDFVRYGTDEIKTRESRESFRELYNLLRSRVIGIDKAFDDILSDEENAPF